MPIELSEDEVCALQMFRHAARSHRLWKAALRSVWERGQESHFSMSAELRALRNRIGPRGLDKVTLPKLDVL